MRWDRRGKYESVEGMEEEREMGERKSAKSLSPKNCFEVN